MATENDNNINIMESRYIKNEILYWTYPIIGYVYNFMIFSAFGVYDAYSRDPIYWPREAVDSIGLSILLCLFFGCLPVLLSYIYLTLLNKQYRYDYDSMTLISIVCTVIISIPLIILLGSIITEVGSLLFFLILWYINFFIPTYWIAYKEYGNGGIKLGLYVILFQLILIFSCVFSLYQLKGI